MAYFIQNSSLASKNMCVTFLAWANNLNDVNKGFVMDNFSINIFFMESSANKCNKLDFVSLF